MSEPRIYTKNYVGAEDLMTVNSGSPSLPKLYDRDPISQYVSSGLASNASSLQIDITFFEGTTAINRYIDTLILLNHNIGAFTLYYWDGSAFQVWATGGGAAAGANSVFTVTARTTAKARFVGTVTFPNDAEKTIGEMVLCALQLDLGKELDGYEVSYRQKVKTLQLGDGSLRQAVVRWAPNRTNKYEARAQFKNASAALHDSLKAIKETNQAFLWYPESAQRPGELFYVNWTAPWTARYSTNYKGAGYDLSMELKEV